VEMDEVQWIIKGLKQPGKTGAGLAKALKLNPSQVTMIKKGMRRVQAAELPVIARYLDLPVPPEVVGAPATGAAAANHFSVESQKSLARAAIRFALIGTQQTARAHDIEFWTRSAVQWFEDYPNLRDLDDSEEGPSAPGAQGRKGAPKDGRGSSPK
jgi:hypothetical protein